MKNIKIFLKHYGRNRRKDRSEKSLLK